MSNVQFDEDAVFNERKYAMQMGKGPGSIPRISTETKLNLSILSAVMIGITIYIWIHYIVVRPVSTNVRDMQSVSSSDI